MFGFHEVCLVEVCGWQTGLGGVFLLAGCWVCWFCYLLAWVGAECLLSLLV